MSEPDEILVQRALAGDTRAFGEIVDRYQRVLYTLALRMVGNTEDARDITQVAFVKAWRGLGTYDPGRRFFSWIYRIAVNECLNHRRGSRRLEEIPEQMESPDPGPEAEVRRRQSEERVQAALLRIPETDRELIVMRHFLDRSYVEIGELLGVPEKTVKSRLFTARQRLKAELARTGARST